MKTKKNLKKISCGLFSENRSHLTTLFALFTPNEILRYVFTLIFLCTHYNRNILPMVHYRPK